MNTLKVLLATNSDLSEDHDVRNVIVVLVIVLLVVLIFYFARGRWWT